MIIKRQQELACGHITLCGSLDSHRDKNILFDLLIRYVDPLKILMRLLLVHTHSPDLELLYKELLLIQYTMRYIPWKTRWFISSKLLMMMYGCMAK